MTPAPSLDVTVIFSPTLKQEGFNGKASAVSSENDLGKFDILPSHANFVTRIFKNLVIHTEDKSEVKYEFNQGVLEVSEDKVKIYLGI